MPENLSLFLDPAPKAEEGTVKKLSKDSILSLYASTPSVHASSMATQGEHTAPLKQFWRKTVVKEGCQIRTHWVGVHVTVSTKLVIVVLNLKGIFRCKFSPWSKSL